MGKEKCAFEVGKTYKTRGGENARVLATDRNHPKMKVVVMFESGDVVTYTKDGFYYDSHDPCSNDLLPPREVVWVNKYKDMMGVHRTKEKAIRNAAPIAIEIAIPFIRATREEVEGA